jgi:hypothetical protein
MVFLHFAASIEVSTRMIEMLPRITQTQQVVLHLWEQSARRKSARTAADITRQ